MFMCVQMGSRSGSGGAIPRPGPGSLDLPLNKTKGHRKTASLGQGSSAPGELGEPWTEEVDQVTACRVVLKAMFPCWEMLTCSDPYKELQRLLITPEATYMYRF